MNQIYPNLSFLKVAPFLALIPVASLAQTTLFSDDFGGDGSDLNGTTPDVTTNDLTWVAGPVFKSDGTTENSNGSATLAFTPEDGLVYTLDASFSDLGLVGDPDSDWFALGFANGQSDQDGAGRRFITADVVGTAWIMHRAEFELGTNQTFLGTGQLGGGNFGLGAGDNTAELWELIPASPEIDLRVVLDTTAGAGSWTATWYAKASTDDTYLEVRPTQNLLPGAVITSVGVARSGPGVTGTVESFSLTSSASAGTPLQLLIANEEAGPRIEVEAGEELEVDLYRSTTAEPGSWGAPISTGLLDGDSFVDLEAPEGRAFYLAVSEGGTAP